jgi:hypothetical protein
MLPMPATLAINPDVMTPPGPAPDKDMVWIPGGSFLMGSNDHTKDRSSLASRCR